MDHLYWITRGSLEFMFTTPVNEEKDDFVVRLYEIPCKYQNVLKTEIIQNFWCTLYAMFKH